MAKKTGLGKGLDALFANTNIDKEESEEIVRNIKIIEIEPNKEQPRRIFKDEAIEELAESIKKYCTSIEDIFILSDLIIKGDKNEILKQLTELILDCFDEDVEITRDTVAEDVDGWDSLGQIRLLAAVEKEFDIHFSITDVRNLENVGDLVDLIFRLR